MTRPVSRLSVPRSGLAPLVFDGWLVRRVSTKGEPIHTKRAVLANRWWELALYRSKTGRWVASAGFRSEQSNELAGYDWATAGSPPEVAAYLAKLGENPLPPTFHVGFAHGSTNWKSSQERLVGWILQQYDRGISSLLEGLPEFGEEV